MKSTWIALTNQLIAFWQVYFWWLYIYTSCANRAQLATAWSTRDTCTVCGHPTMSNYFTMYSYKIVGEAVLAFTYCSSYHCYSYYLSDYKLGVHMYCLWPLPHLLLVCTTLVLFVCTTLVLFMCTTLVLFVCTNLGVTRCLGVTERGFIQTNIQTNFLAPFILAFACCFS